MNADIRIEANWKAGVGSGSYVDVVVLADLLVLVLVHVLVVVVVAVAVVVAFIAHQS